MARKPLPAFGSDEELLEPGARWWAILQLENVTHGSDQIGELLETVQARIEIRLQFR